jgi:Winged helix DNA-binding domain
MADWSDPADQRGAADWHDMTGQADLTAQADVTGPGDVAARFRAQRLDRAGCDGDLVGLVRHLLAVQAQDPVAFPLALRARMADLTIGDLDQARADRTIMRCWGPRGTLHLIATKDLGWLYPLVKPSPVGSVRRLRQLTGTDIDAETGASAAAAALAGQGPLTKTQLGSRLAATGLPVEGQSIVHLALLAACEGLVVLGPERSGKPTYVHAADWLGAPLPTEPVSHDADSPNTGGRDADSHDAGGHDAGSRDTGARDAGSRDTGAHDPRSREAAVRTLVARYQAAHAHGTPADLAAWSGLPRTEITRAWPTSSRHSDPLPARENLPVRLLPGFDEYLLGWRNRDHAVREEHRRLVHPGGGIIRATVLLDGLAAGTWQARRSSRHIDIVVQPFDPLPQTATPGLAAEVADIGAFLGLDARFRVAL